MSKDSGKKSGGSSLTDFVTRIQTFEGLPQILKALQGQHFFALNDQEKQDLISRTLFALIDKTETPCFLLPAVLEYIERVNALELLESYAFFHFELWLNQFSSLSAEENYLVRAKIAGKWIPRDAFQTLFPIGMGKVYPGSHFVTAHGSPDLDTTVASFWGWVDAFTARVAEGLHLWNVPGGPPTSQTELKFLFNEVFGKDVFALLAKGRTTLALSGIDLMTQKGFERKSPSDSTLKMDHERTEHAITVVDDQGYYLGDWRHLDAEGVRQVIMMLSSCLRWFESDLHMKLISLFAQETLCAKDLVSFSNAIFSTRLSQCQPVRELTVKERENLEAYLAKVLKIKKGLECTIQEFAEAMTSFSVDAFQTFIQLTEDKHTAPLFDPSGKLVENRSNIFQYLEKMIGGLDRAIYQVRSYFERLDVALSIKTNVFGHLPHHISYRADVDEIKAKMGSYPYLSVTLTDKAGKLIPLGIVYAQDLHKPQLGTVTLRDFCNREETKIPPYFEVISVIDHHKSQLQTTSAPMALIADAQSSNVLCAELAFSINDRYSSSGMSRQQVNAQADKLTRDLAPLENKRLLSRLLQKQLAEEERGSYFIDPVREALEYTHFLYGILDDTDLLTKVSRRDVECVASLINRLKSLSLREEVEIITLTDLGQDPDFASKAAKRILQHSDMYALYSDMYLAKEKSVEESIVSCAKGKDSCFYADTKEQNGCARVGQVKLFAGNYSSFSKHVAALRKQWYDHLLERTHERPEVDLHLQMISTIAGAEDLYAGKKGDYQHSDELWIWIPFTEQSIEHLKGFLSGFLASVQVQKGMLSVEFYGDRAAEYAQIFAENLIPIPQKVISEKGAPSIAVLKYTAGLINSRKAMISPYLPREA